MAQTDQRAAGYMPPANGPFRCGRCAYFAPPTACHLVSGHIEAQGCCNLFEPETVKPASVAVRLRRRSA